MLEGQEISEVNFSEILKASYSQRIDSTFFSKEFLNSSFAQEVITLNELCVVRSGTTPTDRDDELQEGVVLLKTDSIRNGILNYFSAKDFFFIDIDSSLKMKATALQCDDVLMNIVGATTDVIGRCSVLATDFPPANITQAMALLRIRDDFKNIINPSYLFAYLSSRQGHKQVRRIARPTGQFNMNLQEVGSFLIPLLSLKFQEPVDKLIKNSEILNKDSVAKFAQAEQILLEEVGLADFTPSKQNTNIKTFAQSFGASGRLDAEYYQPKYDAYIQQIKNYKHGFKSIAEVLTIPIKNGTTPSSVTPGYNACEHYFVRVEAFQENLTIDETLFNSLDKEDYQKYKANLTIKNDILVSMTGTIGAVVIYSPEKPALINQNIMRLRCNESIINTESLSIYLKTIGKVLLERVQTGNVQPYVNTSNFEILIVPLIDLKTQTHISELVQQSFTLKAQSEHLLSVAKRAVEMAIEQDEAAAMHFIENSTN